MSITRWLLSAWFCFHLVAVALTAIPDPDQFQPPSLNRTAAGPLTARVAPVLEASATAVFDLTNGAWHLLRPVKTLTDTYVTSIGLLDEWQMFWNPSRRDQYLRVRFHVRAAEPGTGEDWSATELVLPEHPPGAVRGLRAFRTKPREKAIDSAIERFLRRNGRAPGRPAASAPDDLAPVSRYFAERFRRERLTSADELARIELWVGSSPNPAPGAGDAPASAERLAVLERYYEAPFGRLPAVAYARPGDTEVESDITWSLVFVE